MLTLVYKSEINLKNLKKGLIFNQKYFCEPMKFSKYKLKNIFLKKYYNFIHFITIFFKFSLFIYLLKLKLFMFEKTYSNNKFFRNKSLKNNLS